MVRFLALTLLGLAASSSVLAAEEGMDAKAKAAILSLVPNATIDSIAASAVPGFYQVIVQGQVVYVSQDGKYLLQGSVFDISSKTDITEQARTKIRREALAGMESDKRIIFAPDKPKHTVTVFTDIDCGYCRRLHSQMADYNKLGIAIQYMFFPRAGLHSESFNKAVSVWCAADRRNALTQAKNGATIENKTCPNPVEEEYALGQRIGINGTPAVIAADGTLLPGYIPPDQMLARLDEIVAKSKTAVTASAP